MEPVARVFRLLALLQARRYWGGPELADALEVSSRTLRRDVARLRELGYPVEAHPGLAGGYELAAGAVLPPLVVDDEEAVAMALGVLGAVLSPVTGMAEASARALAKVIQVMPRHLRRRVEALATTTERVIPPPKIASVEPVVLTTIAQSCRDSERLEFDYVAGDGTHSSRLVEPYRLVALGSRLYLVAFDLGRRGWRSFRVDRLRSPSVTGSRFAPKELPAQDASSFVMAGITQASRPLRIEARVHAPAAEVARRVGHWASIEESGLTECNVTIRTDSLDLAVAALGLTGAEFEVVEPPELSGALESWSARLARGSPGQASSAGPLR
ncbi:MAG: helix-turn-helix transcriptional regulator [Acidimicrobiales bacterium]